MNLTLENIIRVLDYRTGEAIDEWLARTGLTPNHMRAALNELKLFVREPLAYEPDGSGHVPTHEELSAAWTQPATPPPKRPWWDKPAPEPRQRAAGEVPWWERGRAAGVQREAARDDKPRWWEKSRTIDEIAGRALTPAEIDRALEEIYGRTDLTARGTFGDFCARNGMSREDVIEIFRLNKPDCTYRFSSDQAVLPRPIDIEQRLRDMYDEVDPITGESWADYCRRRGITRADMVASIRSLAHVDWPHESVRRSRERVPSPRSRTGGHDREP